eukprot:1156825-Pelagomonas_calceolata.AAC.3
MDSLALRSFFVHHRRKYILKAENTLRVPSTNVGRLDRCNVFTHCVRSGQPIVTREFVDLRKRLR